MRLSAYRPQLEGTTLRIEVRPEDRAALEWLRQRAIVDVELSSPRRPRSTGPGSQSAHFHGHVGQIAQYLNCSVEMAKRYMKVLASIQFGYPSERMTRDGITVVEPQSEAKASTDEESLLIEMCHAWASQNGLSLYEGDEV